MWNYLKSRNQTLNYGPKQTWANRGKLPLIPLVTKSIQLLMFDNTNILIMCTHEFWTTIQPVWKHIEAAIFFCDMDEYPFVFHLS